MGESIGWEVNWKLYKYNENSIEIVRDELIEPYEVIEGKGNMLMNGGASNIWEYMLGNGTTSAGSALTYFNNARTVIKVGTSTASIDRNQTNLRAGTAGIAIGTMEAGFPSHSVGLVEASRSVKFKSIFGGSTANFSWNEWGIFNGTATNSRMLNRKVARLGSKGAGQTWTFEITIKLN